jgi:hypothetical protein
MFQGRDEPLISIECLGTALDRFDLESQFELWVNQPDGPAICMLRNSQNAWLMYLRHDGDSGFHSLGNSEREGFIEYRLSNGQIDEYPRAWCIPVEDCYKAISFFFVNDGLRPHWLTWQES